MKLALGTAQFGLDYGVSNNNGQVNQSALLEILAIAKRNHIDTLDCAAAYGNSEALLGKLNVSDNFELISKIPTLPDDRPDISAYLTESLQRLACQSLDGLFIHDADNLIQHSHRSQIIEQLIRLKNQGIIKRIGVSCYTPEQLMILAREMPLDIAQVPLNALDQRFAQHDIKLFLQKYNIALHCRSAFLQGLLLMNEKDMPYFFHSFQRQLTKFDQLAKKLNCSKITLALAYVAQNMLGNTIEKIVVGCCSAQQLKELLACYNQAQSLQVSPEELSSLASNEMQLIDPSNWPVKD